MTLGERKRGERLFGCVHAAERLQALIVERLNAERQAIDAGCAVAREVLGLDARGIGFERDLRIGCDVPMLGDGVDDGGDARGPHQRRRSATEEDARHAPPRRKRGEMRKLGKIGGEEPGFVDAAVAHMGVEVAIGAFGAAERPVHIDTERYAHDPPPWGEGGAKNANLTPLRAPRARAPQGGSGRCSPMRHWNRSPPSAARRRACGATARSSSRGPSRRRSRDGRAA